MENSIYQAVFLHEQTKEVVLDYFYTKLRRIVKTEKFLDITDVFLAGDRISVVYIVHLTNSGTEHFTISKTESEWDSI